MWPFNRKSKAASEIGASVQVTKPVENPALEAAIFRHRVERSEDSSIEVGRALNAANYLVPVITDEIAYSKTGDHLVTIETGSVIKLKVCKNANGERFLPAFTSWHEIRLWSGNNANAFVMGARELWVFALADSNAYAGVVINPASSPWTLLPQNIQALLEDYA